MTSIEHVVVVGAGTMGSGIAQELALNGYHATLVDVDEDQLSGSVEAFNARLQTEELGQIQRDRAHEHLHTSTDLVGALQGIDLAIEAVPEDREIKREVFTTCDRCAPDQAILASNTSSISITWLGAQTDRPDQVLGLHFFNPVHRMQLVEVIRGADTSDRSIQTVLEVVERLEKTGVVVEDYPGFVSNRILMPMLNEAMFCAMQGVADPEQIDDIMKLGMNHPMGPLELADFIGLDVCLSIMEVLHNDLGEDKYRPCPLLRRKVNAGKLGRKSGSGFYEYG